MLERSKTRMLPVVSRAVDAAPMATACCNACRTCVQTDLLGIAFAGIGGAALAVKRFFAKPS